jgi:hypothetical protein
MARPTKLTPEIQEIILKAIDIGATYKDAAEAAGINYDTFNNWMKRGAKASSGEFFEFFGAVSRSQASARLKYLSVITKAAMDGDWRAALEYLKRRDREHWGDNLEVKHGGDVGITIKKFGGSIDKI